MKTMFEIWDGDLFLFTLDTIDEAEHYHEAGFSVREIDNA